MTTPAPIPSDPATSTLDTFTIAYLASHEATCPTCGYNVHALPAPTCPECGRHLVLHIVAADPAPTTSWIVLMATTSTTAGMGLFILAVLLHDPIPPRLDWRVILGYFVAHIPAPALVLLTRKTFLGLQPRAQALLAHAAVVLTVTMLGWFLAKVMRL